MLKGAFKHSKKKSVGKLVYRTPRILSIIFILFLTLFSFDVFGEGHSFWNTLLAFLMHNIPSLILLILLIFAWKKEWIGALVFFLVGLVYISWIVINALTNRGEWFMLMWAIQISGPAFLISYMFWLNWKRKKY
jgi:membrane-bound metal-dependent hydrolase YbcI (DUF457 family)